MEGMNETREAEPAQGAVEGPDENNSEPFRHATVSRRARSWMRRAVRMFRWTGRAWWMTIGMIMVWAVPGERSEDVANMVLWNAAMCALFGAFAAFCFIMSFRREGGER